MTYYLITKGSRPPDVTDHNILGEISFDQFHVGIAWGVLRKLVDNNNTAVLEKLDIVDSTGVHWEISAFLSFLTRYKFIHY